MITSTKRVARTTKACDGCGEPIKAGGAYMEHKVPPHHPSLRNDAWLVKRECLACAGRLGRREDQPPEDFMTPLFDADAIA